MARRRSRGSARRRAGRAARPRKAREVVEERIGQVAATGAFRKLPDYESQLAAKDAQVQELQTKVAEAAKTSEATQDLNDRVAALMQAMADERVGFALVSAGVRNVKAGRPSFPTTTVTIR